MKRALLFGILLVGITIVLLLMQDNRRKNAKQEEANPQAVPTHRNDTMNNGMTYLIETSL